MAFRETWEAGGAGMTFVARMALLGAPPRLAGLGLGLSARSATDGFRARAVRVGVGPPAALRSGAAAVQGGAGSERLQSP